MNRTFNVVRMQLVNQQTYIWVPLIVLGGAFAITLMIWGLVRSAGADGVIVGGGSQAPFWYFLVVGVQALTLTFPFSQAMSVTRREFYLGTLLTAALTSAMLAAVFVVGAYVEIATDGWGMQGYFFAPDWLWSNGPLVTALFYFALGMLFFVIGFAASTFYKRFGTLWLTVLLVGLGVVLVGLMWLQWRMDTWGQIFSWFASIGITGLTGCIAALAAVLAVVAFPLLRRATP